MHTGTLMRAVRYFNATRQAPCSCVVARAAEAGVAAGFQELRAVGHDVRLSTGWMKVGGST